MARRQRRNIFQLVRDIVLFVVGFVGLIVQAFFTHPIDPIPLAIFAGMCGFPGISNWTVNVVLPGARPPSGSEHDLSSPPGSP